MVLFQVMRRNVTPDPKPGLKSCSNRDLETMAANVDPHLTGLGFGGREGLRCAGEGGRGGVCRPVHQQPQGLFSPEHSSAKRQEKIGRESVHSCRKCHLL